MQHLVHHDLYFKEVYRIYITYEKKNNVNFLQGNLHFR